MKKLRFIAAILYVSASLTGFGQKADSTSIKLLGKIIGTCQGDHLAARTGRVVGRYPDSVHNPFISHRMKSNKFV